MEKYIEFEHVGKTFPGQKALDDVSFSIRKGEIHAIIGENGAGKSTLLNILHGVFPATTGEIRIDGKAVKFAEIADAIDAGIAKVHQEIVSIPDMTVAENLFMGKEPGRYGIIDKKKMNQDTETLLKRLNCNIQPTDRMGDLSTGQKQMVSIAKALEVNATVMIFDEPTKGIDIGAKADIYLLMEKMAEQGVAIIMVSSELTEVMGMSDRIIVMRDGEITGELAKEEFSEQNILNYTVEGN